MLSNLILLGGCRFLLLVFKLLLGEALSQWASSTCDTVDADGIWLLHLFDPQVVQMLLFHLLENIQFVSYHLLIFNVLSEVVEEALQRIDMGVFHGLSHFKMLLFGLVCFLFILIISFNRRLLLLVADRRVISCFPLGFVATAMRPSSFGALLSFLELIS